MEILYNDQVLTHGLRSNYGRVSEKCFRVVIWSLKRQVHRNAIRYKSRCLPVMTKAKFYRAESLRSEDSICWRKPEIYPFIVG